MTAFVAWREAEDDHGDGDYPHSFSGGVTWRRRTTARKKEAGGKLGVALLRRRDVWQGHHDRRCDHKATTVIETMGEAVTVQAETSTVKALAGDRVIKGRRGLRGCDNCWVIEIG